MARHNKQSRQPLAGRWKASLREVMPAAFATLSDGFSPTDNVRGGRPGGQERSVWPTGRVTLVTAPASAYGALSAVMNLRPSKY